MGNAVNPYMKMSPQKVELTLREAEALTLKKQGWTHEMIAKKLDVVPSTVSRMISRALSKTLAIPSEELRKLYEDRYEALLGAVWPQAMMGDTQSVAQARAVLKDLRELRGVDKLEESRPMGLVGIVNTFDPALAEKLNGLRTVDVTDNRRLNDAAIEPMDVEVVEDEANSQAAEDASGENGDVASDDSGLLSAEEFRLKMGIKPDGTQ